MPAHKKFTIEERVRWGDVDAARIIFYGAYIHFFEFAETELFREVGLAYGTMFDELKIWLPRVHLECDFRRAAQLEINPYAALVFYWPQLERQVRVEGKVEKTSAEESAAYFKTRPRESQIG